MVLKVINTGNNLFYFKFKNKLLDQDQERLLIPDSKFMGSEKPRFSTKIVNICKHTDNGISINHFSLEYTVPH